VAWEPESGARAESALGMAGFVFIAGAIVGAVLGAVWLIEPVVLRGMVLQFVVLMFPVWVLGWVPWRAIDAVGGPDRDLMQLAMVSVTSLVVFVVLWYVVMFSSGWGFGNGAQWSTALTFLAPVGLLAGLAGATGLGARWRA